jgi:phosphomevalonate kinase
LAVATLNFNKVALGIIISAAVLLDQLFSNYKRMMTATVAGAAVARTIRKVQNNYNDQVLDVIKKNQQGNAAAASDLLLELARLSSKTVRDEMDRIKTAVSEANIQFLSSLNMDQPATTVLPHASVA